MLKKHKRNGGNPRIRKKCFSLGVFKFKGHSIYRIQKPALIRNTSFPKNSATEFTLPKSLYINTYIYIYIHTHTHTHTYIYIAKYLHSKHWLVKECYKTFFNTLFTIE